MSIYGIDLGTTNSLIGLHESDWLSEMVPSCVDIDNGKAGRDYYENMSATRSFKVDMSMGTEGIRPRVASKVVLQSLAKMSPFGEVKDVVISVPAYFSDNQRTATLTAAADAGLNVRGLVNEPTAAAMFIAQQRKGLFVVFDLGGGTFDVSIIDSRFGSYDVQATSGRIVGGDNFDQTIMKFFIKSGEIPIHHMNATSRMELQHFATKQKIRMQKERAPFEVDLSPWSGKSVLLNPETYISLMKMTFSETINCTNSLINKFIPENEVYDILLVGGSTHCPYLRDWIEDVTGKKPAPLTYNPDIVVAQGAALYANILDNDNIDKQVSDVTRALSIALYDGTASVIVPANSKIPLVVEKMFSNPQPATSLVLDLYQGESMFVKDNELIGTLIWDYGEPKDIQEGQVIVKVSIDNKGVITFSANELLRQPKVVILSRNKC